MGPPRCGVLSDAVRCGCCGGLRGVEPPWPLVALVVRGRRLAPPGGRGPGVACVRKSEGVACVRKLMLQRVQCAFVKRQSVACVCRCQGVT
jgi:hypothetical protein